MAPENTNRWKRRALGSVIGQGGDLRREGVPAGLGVDRQAGVHPARDDRTRLELGAEFGGDGQPSLAVHRVPVLAGEHLRASPVICVRLWAGCGRSPRGSVAGSPLCATSRHFAAF